MLTFITLPSDFAGNIASTTTDTLSSFSPYIVLIIGVLLAGLVLNLILDAVKHR